jgi:hypothetical protein
MNAICGDCGRRVGINVSVIGNAIALDGIGVGISDGGTGEFNVSHEIRQMLIHNIAIIFFGLIILHTLLKPA